jgi:hypothetical protein
VQKEQRSARARRADGSDPGPYDVAQRGSAAASTRFPTFTGRSARLALDDATASVRERIEAAMVSLLATPAGAKRLPSEIRSRSPSCPRAHVESDGD